MAAWFDLPIDLLCCISSKLLLVDFLRFSAVCTSWYSVLTNNADLGIHFSPSPWLLLPSDAGEASDTLTFRDFTIKEEDGVGCQRRFSPLGRHISGRRCIGSKDGWLVTLDKTDLQPRLFNPLTKAEISLPSLFTIPDDQWQRMRPKYTPDGSLELYYEEIHRIFSTGPEDFRDVYFWKIVFSSNDPFGTVVVIYGYLKLLAFVRPGDPTWVPGPPPYCFHKFDQFHDVYYHKEEKKFYAITCFSTLLTFDLNGQNVELICSPIQDIYAINPNSHNYIYILLGTLLKIERVIKDFMTDEGLTWKTIKISVFKFVPTVDTSSYSSFQWISVKDLGDCSLFIGCNETFSLHHTVAPGIRPNCIYFTDHWEEMSPENVHRDAGLFDLHNDCFHHFFDASSQPTWPPSIWFTPSLS